METRYEKLVRILTEKELHLATAESLTGGMIASRIVDVPGASKVLTGGFVTYCDAAKHQLLGVSEETLARFGAVSAETAYEMAEGAAKLTGAQVAVSVTGNAGPDAAEGKPVGMVFIGILADGAVQTFACRFAGDRQQIRTQTADEAVRYILQAVGAEKQ